MLKVNLHLLEGCNFHCRTCFAHFDSHRLLSCAEWKQIIDNLHRSGKVDAVNFAGGEPLLYPQLDELIKYAHDLGFKTSIITNGSRVTIPWLRKNAAYLDMIGFSIDSFDYATSVKMGRCTHSFQTFGKEEFMKIYPELIAQNVKIKINTVVNRLNLHEQISQHLDGLKIDRWKLLKMKPFDNGKFSNYNIAITDEEFNDFVQRNPHPGRIVENSLVNSYFVIDAKGDFLDNSRDTYQPVGSLLREDFNTVFSRYNFDKDLYNSRYTPDHKIA